jgi:hypothetical protein
MRPRGGDHQEHEEGTEKQTPGTATKSGPGARDQKQASGADDTPPSAGRVIPLRGWCRAVWGGDHERPR